ncbi:heterokaryon incompatibility protein [Neofusicoccum parvum]|nr:heterokaryon incompatibility protein [Neofusicoccum parvum]
MEAPTPINYTPLAPEPQGFRILVLNPSPTFSAEIGCSLMNAFLDDPPAYEALSYVWGDPTKTHSITVNGKEVAVTRNLECALRHLRHPDTPRHLWVDALCINQHDIDERDDQVLHMGDIYRYCTTDLLWLGAEASILTQGAAAMKTIGTITQLEEKFVRWRRRFCDSDSPETQDQLPKDWQERLRDLFQTPEVWRRVWIMQEVSFAPRVVLVAGDATMPWEDIDAFLDVDRYIEKHGFPDAFHEAFSHEWSLKTTFNNTLAHAQILAHQRRIVAATKKQQQKQQASKPTPSQAHEDASPSPSDQETPTSLLNILARFRYTHSTDPRDKIFALLSLTPSPLSLRPTYHLPAPQVFASTALALINASRSLDLLCQPPWPLSSPSLPTWVPDFAANPTHRPALLFAQRAIFAASPAPLLSEQVDASSAGTQLRLAGWHAGALRAVRSRAFFSTAAPWGLRRRCRRALEWMPDALLRGAGDRDGDGDVLGRFVKGDEDEEGGTWEQRFEAYWRTLLVDCVRYPVRRIAAEEVAGTLGELFGRWMADPLGEGAVADRVEGRLGMCDEWVFAVARDGGYAMVPPEAEVGDCVAVLEGAKTPVVLRRVGSEGESERPHVQKWAFVGACYWLGGAARSEYRMEQAGTRAVIIFIRQMAGLHEL